VNAQAQADWTELGGLEKPSLLPIELTLWTVDCAPTVNTLRWQTATETRNDYFTLERSFDGVSFATIAQIDGAGTSSQIQNYVYQDAINDEQTTYYRLSQTDNDGVSQEFEVIATNCQFAYQIYTIGYHSIVADFYSDTVSVYSFAVYDLHGNRIAALSGTAEEGFNQIEIDNLNLSPSIYVAELKHNGIVQTKKLYLSR
jgi:hypothetical protein